MLENGKFDFIMNGNRCINPSADVAPVRHGRWEYYDTYMDGITIFRCTCCGDLQSGRDGFGWKKNYCPNCGAKMDLEADHGNKS